MSNMNNTLENNDDNRRTDKLIAMTKSISGIKAKVVYLPDDASAICNFCGERSRNYKTKQSANLWIKLHNKVCIEIK